VVDLHDARRYAGPVLHAVLLAVLLLVSGRVVAEDDDGGLDSPGLRGSSDDDDEPPDEPTDEDIEQYWEEDEADREELLDLDGGDASAERMEDMADDVEREAEDAGEPEDILSADPNAPDPGDPYAAAADEDEEDPFAEVIKDPYETHDPEEPSVELDDGAGEPAAPGGAHVPGAPPSAPPLGSPLDEDDGPDAAP
jgi:hypothetical protein